MSLSCIPISSGGPSTVPTPPNQPKSRPAAHSLAGECSSVEPAKRNHANELPVRKSSSTGLIGGLVGFEVAVAVITSNYKRSASHELLKLNVNKDVARIGKIFGNMRFLSGGEIHSACNRSFTGPQAEKTLAHACSFSAPVFAYLGGHADLSNDEKSFVYVPDDCTQTGQADLSGKITSAALRDMIIDRNGFSPTMMILLTDFCYSDNFLRLPWTLRLEGGNCIWEKSQEYLSTWNNQNRILHFTAGSQGLQTYSFESTGSLFCREFFNAENSNSEGGVSLSERMKMIRNGTSDYCDAYNKQNNENIRQEPQLYASHPFELNNPTTLLDLLRSLKLSA